MLAVGVEEILVGIMVDVENDEHIAADGVIHHLLHAAEPLFADVEISVHMVVPGHRDADGVEALILQGLDHLGGGVDAAPVFFDGHFIAHVAVAGGVEGVAKVPAHLDLADEAQGFVIGYLKRKGVLLGEGRHNDIGGFGGGQRHGGQQHQGKQYADQSAHMGFLLCCVRSGRAYAWLHEACIFAVLSIVLPALYCMPESLSTALTAGTRR